MAKVRDPLIRSRLSSLARYGSANGILPTAVNEKVVDDFLDYRTRAWNANLATIQGWPKQPLAGQPLRD